MFPCMICSKEYHWPGDLTRHMKCKHVERNQPVQMKVTENMQAAEGNHYFPEVQNTYMVFQHPLSMVVAGPSGCGKTVFVVKLLKNLFKMVDQNIDDILWYHGMEQHFHQEIKQMFPRVSFMEGLPDCSKFDPLRTRLCIVDDMMSQTKGNVVADLFAKGSHHTNTSIIYIVQNLFHRNKEQRDISLNTKYLVLFKNPRDGQQVGTLASQMGKHDLIKGAYEHATSKPYGYVLIDLTQTAKDALRVRSQIFPDDEDNIVYLTEPINEQGV